MSVFKRDYDLPANEAHAWVRDEQLALFLELCISTAIIYDTIITMDVEVLYFWDKNLSFSKIVFFLNRYLGIIGALMSTIGSVAEWTGSICFAITVISLDYVLTLRVLALYHNEKKISVFLYGLLALEAVAKIVFTGIGTKLQPALIVGLSPHASYCGYNDIVPPSIFIIDWSIFLAYGSLLLCLALFKGRQIWKLNGYSGSRLAAVLIRDQALYFVIAIFSSVTDILGNRISNNTVIYAVFISFGKPSFLCILGSRLFFNLKEASEHGINVGTNWASYSHSAIHFDESANEISTRSRT